MDGLVGFDVGAAVGASGPCCRSAGVVVVVVDDDDVRVVFGGGDGSGGTDGIVGADGIVVGNIQTSVTDLTEQSHTDLG
jgi:hypothetical protein